MWRSIETLKHFLEVGAVLVAGWWTYHLFVRGRQHKQKADLTIRADATTFDAEHRYLRVEFTLQNVGNVAIVPSSAHCSIQQVLPYDDTGRRRVDNWRARRDAGGNANRVPDPDGGGGEPFDPCADDPEEAPRRICEVEIPWPVVDDWYIDLGHEDDIVTLEPQESETWQADFVLDGAVLQVQISVAIWSASDDFLWDSAMVVDLNRIDLSLEPGRRASAPLTSRSAAEGDARAGRR